MKTEKTCREIRGFNKWYPDDYVTLRIINKTVLKSDDV